MAKHAGGAPTKYNESILKKVDDYLLLCEDQYYDYEKTIGEKSNSYERRVLVKLPSIEGLALFLNVNPDTIQEWKSLHSKFSVSLRKIEALQKERLMSSGLSGDYNPTIAKLLLSANHGMKEKSETDVISGGEKLQPILVKFLDNDTKNN